jgi:hypothetical protein
MRGEPAGFDVLSAHIGIESRRIVMIRYSRADMAVALGCFSQGYALPGWNRHQTPIRLPN